MQGQSLVYKYVGQLYLESRHELDRLAQEALAREDSLRALIAKLEQERDELLSLLSKAKE